MLAGCQQLEGQRRTVDHLLPAPFIVTFRTPVAPVEQGLLEALFAALFIEMPVVGAAEDKFARFTGFQGEAGFRRRAIQAKGNVAAQAQGWLALCAELHATVFQAGLGVRAGIIMDR